MMARAVRHLTGTPGAKPAGTGRYQRTYTRVEKNVPLYVRGACACSETSMPSSCKMKRNEACQQSTVVANNLVMNSMRGRSSKLPEKYVLQEKLIDLNVFALDLPFKTSISADF